MQDYQYLCMKKTLETGGNAICTDYGKGDCLECMGMNKFRMTRKYLLEMRGNYFTQQLDKTDLFVVPSLEGKKHLVNAGFRDERIQVVSNLLDIPDIPQMENPDMGLIVFLGDISPQAGADVALEAFKKVFDDVGHCRMAMVGRERDTEYMEEKKTWLKNNKLQEQVKFITSGDAGEMAHYLASAEVVVVADQWPDMFNEKILTTLAFGRPVVAGDVGNARELVESGRTGFLVKYNDPGQYAKMIINIIRNPENSYNLGRTARSGFYQLYQPHEITGRMLDIYQALVDTYQKKSTAGKGTRNKEPDFSG